MARVQFEAVEAWMAEHKLRPADAARLFGVSTQRFNGWRSRGQVSADASDDVIKKMGKAPVSRIAEIATTTGDSFRIDLIAAEADMGDGRINEDFPEVIRAVEFPPD